MSAQAKASGVHAKGTIILARLSFVQETYPEDWQRYLSSLAPATREAFEAGFLKSSFYPIEMLFDASRTAERLFGTGSRSLQKGIAAYSARMNMPTVYKIFLRLGSPEFMVKRFARIWGSMYDSGVASSEARDGHAAVEVRAFGAPDPLHCEGTTGFMEECLRIVGVDGSVAHTKCRCEGADVCRWEAVWRKR